MQAKIESNLFNLLKMDHFFYHDLAIIFESAVATTSIGQSRLSTACQKQYSTTCWQYSTWKKKISITAKYTLSENSAPEPVWKTVMLHKTMCSFKAWPKSLI